MQFAVVESSTKKILGEWDAELDEKLAPAVESAKRKAMAYHCRSPFYVAA